MTISLFLINFHDFILFFTLYSFLGWILEVIYAFYAHKKFVNRGFLNGPFCPIYGFGSLIIISSLNNFKDNIFVLFILGTLLTSLIEYLTAVILEKTFKTTWWDYTDDAFNIKGRVCLLFSIIWGLVSVVLVTLIHPIIETLIYSIPISIRKYLFLILIVYFFIDLIITLKALINLTKLLSQIELLYFDRMTEFKDRISNTNITSLKENYVLLINKFTPNHIRLFKAFPTMKFKGLSNLMNDIRSKLNSIINN